MSEDSGKASSTPKAGFQPAPREEWTLLSQGAEAKVWKLSLASSDESSSTILCKERFSKAYRHPSLDERLTKTRCRTEARVLEKCSQKSNLRVPRVIRLEPPMLYMEYIDGPSLKSYLRQGSSNGSSRIIPYSELAKMMGEMIGKLHALGVIHGDLTTSNMLVLKQDQESTIELVLIDFGLSKSSSAVEEQAVDLYVLERALESTHPELPSSFFPALLETYETFNQSGASNKKNQQSTLHRLEQVRLRGRKRECFG